jgi:hypothetical protein
MKKEVFDRLAASGRYLNTGKVLIGLQHQPKRRPLTRDDERLQAALLRAPVKRVLTTKKES